MIKKAIVLPSERTLTLAFAQQVVDTGRSFESMLKMECGTASVNIRSMLGMISLNRFAKEPAVLIAEGRDEKDALQVVSALFEKGRPLQADV